MCLLGCKISWHVYYSPIKSGPGHPQVTGDLSRRLTRLDQPLRAADLGIRELLAAPSKISTYSTTLGD